jgi:spore photoproduct lyase
MQSTLKEYADSGDPMAVTSFSISDAKKMISSEDQGFSVRARNGGPISLKIGNVLTINGRIKKIVTEVGDGSIITLFDKTPYPVKDSDVVCPHFMELKWANGCNFDCAWCYLNGTLRFRPMGKAPYVKDNEKIVAHIKEYITAEEKPTLLNSGELSDSLVHGGNGFSLAKSIIPLFKNQKKHKLLIVTKSANMRGILKSESQDHVIVSFSVNAMQIARRWEKKTPSPNKRIDAANMLVDNGYRVRLRIDPVVPVDNWKESYENLVDRIYSKFEPERITFGSLRGLQSTINFSRDKSWTKYLDDRSNWGLKPSKEKRKEMYAFLIDKIRKYDTKCDVALCKETKGMWKEIGMEYRKIKCNCMM